MMPKDQGESIPSLKLTRYGSGRLAAPGTGGIMRSTAKPRLPTRAA
jgi:hypothetical protein